MNFVVESTHKIYFAENGGKYGGGWLVTGDVWKDFVLEDEPNAKLHFKRINDFIVEVKITGLSKPEKLKFSSTGDLNFVTERYEFVKFNMTETFDYYLLSDYSYLFNLSVDLNVSNFDNSDYIPVGILEWNNTNYTATLDYFDNLTAILTYNLTVSNFATNYSIISHRWYFNYTDWFNLSYQNQYVTNVSVGACNSFTNYTVWNLSYFDETTDESLIVDSNTYDLAFWDGVNWLNLTGVFSNSLGNTFCSNVDPANLTYNWDVFGTFTLEKGNYVTRIHTIDEGAPESISNNPIGLLDLYMIGVNDSTTVAFTWLTTEFQPVDGTMKISKCDSGNTTLVDSIAIINGVAYANLQLLLTPYSYEVVIDGVTYTDSWTECHIEAATERELYVDLDRVSILPVIGLFLVDCVLSNVSDVVSMRWSANPEDTSSIEACIIGSRQSIYNRTQIYKNCSNATSGVHSVTVPDFGNTYYISGIINQNGVQGYCRETLVFYDRSDASKAFGTTGILAIILLILSFALMYSASGERMVAAAVVGLIGAFVLGLTSMPWYVISGVVFLGVIVVLVGRYTKSGSVF